jgi:hypothetical protein
MADRMTPMIPRTPAPQAGETMHPARRRRGPSDHAIDLDDALTLRWQLHVLWLALEGLRSQESAIEDRDLDALAWHVHAMQTSPPIRARRNPIPELSHEHCRRARRDGERLTPRARRTTL